MTEKTIDWMHVQKLLMNLVSDIISGEVEYVDTEAVLKLPKSMIEMLEYVAAANNEKLDAVISEYASAGITTQLQQLIGESLGELGLDKEVKKNKKDTVIDPIDAMKEMGIDTKGLQETLNQLQNLASQLDASFKVE